MDISKWDKWGTRGYTVMPHVSPESKRIAESYKLRPTDVVVLSFPKTGTTWTQTVCEQLRTNGEGYDGFDDITERQPWLDFAYDCGQDLDDHSKASPRIFKSHQLLSAINPGGKYLCIVRDPCATLLSWFAFQKAKGRPGYAEFSDANEYIEKRPELFSSDTIFGTNIWEMYAEVWSARNDPSVKILVYEALIADAPNFYMDHLPILSEFLGIHKEKNEEEIKELYLRVATLVSRAEMVKHVDKFDDHFIAEKGKEYGRALRIMEPAAKVRDKSDEYLSENTKEWLEDQWLERMAPITGHSTYDEFATDLSDLFFRNIVQEDSGILQQSENERIIQSNQVQPRHSNLVLRRKSSLVLEAMPGIRRRRESLAPHE